MEKIMVSKGGSGGDTLEALRHLINASIDVVQRTIAEHDDDPLDLNPARRHPLRGRYDEETARALKCLSSAGVMLRALCDPEAWLNDIIFGHHDLTALFVACEADVANLLGTEALHVDDIAVGVGVEPDMLARHLRALCNVHVFREVSEGVFENNEISILLKSKCRRAFIGHCAEEIRPSSSKQWQALTRPDFRNSKASNRSAFNIAFGTDLDIFRWWEAERPDLGRRGALAFAAMGCDFEQGFALYPWAEEEEGSLIVDVGGGVGSATLPVVNRVKGLRLEVQDLAENEDNFNKYLQENYPQLITTDTVRFKTQDFFEENQTRDAQIYHLRHVLHDWSDADATKILQNIASSMSPRSKILICEHVIFPTYKEENPTDEAQSHDDDERERFVVAPLPLLPNWGPGRPARLDLQVLAVVNGRQRSAPDFERLAAGAGLRLARFWRNLGDDVVVELRR